MGEKSDRDLLIETHTIVKEITKQMDVVNIFMASAPCRENTNRIKDVNDDMRWSVRVAISGLISGVIALAGMIYKMVT